MSTESQKKDTVSYAMFRPRLTVPGVQTNNGAKMQLYKPIRFDSGTPVSNKQPTTTKSDIQNTLTNSGSKSIEKEKTFADPEPVPLAPLLTDATLPSVFAKNNVSSTAIASQNEPKKEAKLPDSVSNNQGNDHVVTDSKKKWVPSKTVKTILYGLLAFIIAFIVIFVLFYTLNPVFVQQKPAGGMPVNKDSVISIDQPPSLTKVSLYALAAGLIAASLPHIYAKFIAKKK